MLNYKRGDKIKVYDALGNKIDAIFLRLDNKKHGFYAVELKRPLINERGLSKKITWYIPESRFVK